MQSDAPLSLFRALSVIRESTFANQFVSAVGSNAATVLLEDNDTYYIGQTAYNYAQTNGSSCRCDQPNECYMPVGISNITMLTNFLTSINLGAFDIFEDYLMVFDGLFAGCVPLESLLQSSLTCFYDKECLQSIQQSIAIQSNLSTLVFSDHNQLTPNSTIMEMMEKLFVQQWKVNTSYDHFFAACAPTVCPYTYTQSANFIYIISTLLGYYGGLGIALNFLILLLNKYHERRNNKLQQPDQSLFWTSIIFANSSFDYRPVQD